MGCLIVFRSVTYAQNGSSHLSRNHITAVITRPPAGLAKGGCSYALKVRDQDLSRALDILTRAGVPWSSAFRKTNTGWQEVAL